MALLGHKVLTQMQRLRIQTTHSSETQPPFVDVDLAGGTHSQALSGRKSQPVQHEVLCEEERTNAAPSIQDILNPIEPYLENLDDLTNMHNLFTNDGTLQAMDTLFDSFLGLDLPAPFFDVSPDDTNDSFEAGRA